MSSEVGFGYTAGGYIPTYVSELDGKDFSSNYIYQVQNNNGGPYNNGNGVHYGSIATFVYPSDIHGTVTSVDPAQGLFNLDGKEYQAFGATMDGNYLTFGTPYSGSGTGSSDGYYVLSNSGTRPPNGLMFGDDNAYTAPEPVCFAQGTMIATPCGEVAVEDLRQGEAVTGADGRTHRIVWIGHRRTECTKSPWKADVSPILFEIGSISENVPCRPLMVSPGHSIEVENGWLIQAGHLVNGSTIRQIDVPSVTYWHIELEEHAILLANGVPAESYLDVGNRSEFANGGAKIVIHPRFLAEQMDLYCMPVIQDPVVRSYFREKLASRSPCGRIVAVAA